MLQWPGLQRTRLCCCCCLKVSCTRLYAVYFHSFSLFYFFSGLSFLPLSPFSYFPALHPRLNTWEYSTVQCKYLIFMVCCCPAWHKQNAFCHLSHWVYASIINRLVPERKAEALARRWFLFSSASTTGISHEHLDHIALQGKVANCTFQVGLYGVHS